MQQEDLEHLMCMFRIEIINFQQKKTCQGLWKAISHCLFNWTTDMEGKVLPNWRNSLRPQHWPETRWWNYFCRQLAEVPALSDSWVGMSPWGQASLAPSDPIYIAPGPGASCWRLTLLSEKSVPLTGQGQGANRKRQWCGAILNQEKAFGRIFLECVWVMCVVA